MPTPTHVVLSSRSPVPRLVAGQVIDEDDYRGGMAELARAGVALLPYSSGMDDALAAFRGLPLSRSAGDLVALLAAAGFIGGGAGSGDVVGPASATDGAVARFDTTTGKRLQNSSVLISDTGSISVPGGQTVGGRNLATDGAKLDGIETGADVTDAANVAAAGAVMESDFTPAHSLLVQQAGTGSPSALSVPVSTLLGRQAGGGSPIAALTPAQVRALLDYPAGEVTYDNATSGLTATDVQDAIDELAASPSGGFPTIRTVRGFAAGATAADRAAYERAGGNPFPGDCGIACLFSSIAVSTGAEQRIIGTTTEFPTNGIAIGFQAPGYLAVRLRDNSGTDFLIDSFDLRGGTRVQFIVVSVDTVTGNVRVWRDGVPINGSGTAIATGALTGGDNLTIGAPSGGSGPTAAAAGMEIHGGAIRIGATYSEAEVFAWWRAIRDGGGIGSGPTTGADEAWEATAATPTASAWSPAVGATSLARLGTATDPTLHNELGRVWF